MDLSALPLILNSSENSGCGENNSKQLHSSSRYRSSLPVVQKQECSGKTGGHKAFSKFSQDQIAKKARVLARTGRVALEGSTVFVPLLASSSFLICACQA